MGIDKRKQKARGKDGVQNFTQTSKDNVKSDWADGLKQLYDSVVDEPLPESFKDLIERLDDTE